MKKHRNQTKEELKRLAFSAYCVAGSIVGGAIAIAIAVILEK